MWFPYYAIAGSKLSDRINHYGCQKQPREVEKMEQLVYARSNRFCKHNRGSKFEHTSVCNTEHIDSSMEVYTFTQLLGILVMKFKQ